MSLQDRDSAELGRDDGDVRRRGGQGQGQGQRNGGARQDGASPPAPAPASTTAAPSVALNLTNMKVFLTTPVPRGAGVVQCYIRRNKTGTNKLYPVYTLYMKVDILYIFLRLATQLKSVIFSCAGWRSISNAIEKTCEQHDVELSHFDGRRRFQSRQLKLRG